MVVYDDLSGDTQKLDLVTAEVFKRLRQGEATLSQLTDHLAKALDLEGNRRLAHIAETAVTRLAAQGLVAQDLVQPQAGGANAPARPPRR